MSKLVDIIIPVGKGDNPETTLRSLAAQTFTDFNIIVSYDTVGNANAARNQGFKLSTAPYVLFADADLTFFPDAIAILVNRLEIFKKASYAYGAYYLITTDDNGREMRELKCNRYFSGDMLKRISYISANTMFRREHFPGWDEAILRLQDWDLFLTMLKQNFYGIYSTKVLFETKLREGISHNNSLSWEEARSIVVKKHGEFVCG